MHNMKRTLIYALIFTMIMPLSGCGLQKKEKQEDNTIKITKAQIEEYKQNKLENYFQQLSDEEAANILVEREVLLREARKRGVEATMKEAREQAKEQKAGMEKAVNGDTVKQDLDDYLKKMNMTQEEYWNTNLPKVLVNTISRANAKKAIEAEVDQDIFSDHSEWTPETIKIERPKLYQARIEELKKKYTITVEE